MITVYHWKYRPEAALQTSRSGFFGFKPEEAKAILDGDDLDFYYAEVAKVAVEPEDFDGAYQLTNHINQAWWCNERVTTTASDAAPQRSTSVGDLLVDGAGRRVTVSSFGFSDLA